MSIESDAPAAQLEPTAGATTFSGEGRVAGFSVHLANFDGPFDLLLQLISRHRMDISEVALASVTDEFISYMRTLDGTEAGWKLDHATEFVVVAATLLDLKAARLLPSGEIEDEDDLALLEARDLLLPGCFNTAHSKKFPRYSPLELLRKSGLSPVWWRWSRHLRRCCLRY